MDTNARNVAARGLYKKLGYKEIGIVPTEFNGIPDAAGIVGEALVIVEIPFLGKALKKKEQASL